MKMVSKELQDKWLLFDGFTLSEKTSFTLEQCVALSLYSKDPYLPNVLIHLHPINAYEFGRFKNKFTTIYNLYSDIKQSNIFDNNYFYLVIHGGSTCFIQGKKIDGLGARDKVLYELHKMGVNYFVDFETKEEIYDKGLEVPKRILIPNQDGSLLVQKKYSNGSLIEEVFSLYHFIQQNK